MFVYFVSITLSMQALTYFFTDGATGTFFFPATGTVNLPRFAAGDISSVLLVVTGCDWKDSEVTYDTTPSTIYLA